MQNISELNQTNLTISKKPEPLSSVIKKGIYAGKFYFPLLIPFSFLYVIFTNIPEAYYAAQTTVESLKEGTDPSWQLIYKAVFIGILLRISCYSIAWIIYAAMIYRLNYILENKNDVGLWTALKFGSSKILSLWGLFFLSVFLIGIIVFLFAFILSFLFAHNQDPLFIIFAIIIIPVLYLVVKLFYGTFTIVLRNHTPIQSLKNSWKLTTGHWWKTAFALLGPGFFMII